MSPTSRSFRRRWCPACLLALVAVVAADRAAAAGERWRFVVTGDSRGRDRGLDAAIVSETARAAVGERAEFILFTGDLVTGMCDLPTFEAQLIAWRNALAPALRAGIRIYPVQGNHETTVPGSPEAWNRVFTGPLALPTNGPAGALGITYAVAHRNVLVLALDQTGREVDLAWVTAQLAANSRPHVFAMGHYPAFKVQHSDNLDDSAPARNAFWRTLRDSGVRVYFAGHDHFFDHARIDDGDGDRENDLQQMILGGGGAPLYKDGAYDGDNGPYAPVRITHDQQFGYALVEIDGSDVTITWKRRVRRGVFRPSGTPFSYSVPGSPAAPPVAGPADRPGVVTPASAGESKPRR